MDDLILWLRAQIDVDEQTARDFEYVAVPHGDDPGDDYLARYEVRFGPARVLREVEAKREIIRKWEVDHGNGYPDYSGGYESALEDVIHVIAAAYSDRPGYREEWKP